MFTALGVACPDCARQPGEACLGIAAGEFHAQRRESAEFLNGVGNVDPVPVEAFDRAVEESGLV